MTEVSSGSAPYIYVSTRMRVRKSKLIPREEYLRMLNMGLPELTRLVEEMEYKREIDELAASFVELTSLKTPYPGIWQRSTRELLHWLRER